MLCLLAVHHTSRFLELLKLRLGLEISDRLSEVSWDNCHGSNLNTHGLLDLRMDGYLWGPLRAAITDRFLEKACH